jgi:hypothetical protein
MIVIAAFAITSVGSIQASLLVSTFGPGDTFLDSPYVIGSSVLKQEIAAAFTPDITTMLDSVRLAASFESGPNDFTIYIARDGAGEPGSALESFEDLSLSSPARIVTLQSVSHPVLIAGVRYWIVMTVPDLVNSRGGWHLNNQGFSGVLARNFFNDFVWTLDPGPTPAFEVQGTTVVSEPATFVSTIGGISLLLWRTYARRS